MNKKSERELYEAILRTQFNIKVNVKSHVNGTKEGENRSVLDLSRYYTYFRSAVVVVIGCGGLGSNTAQLLVRSGVGNVILIDDDVVNLSNLPRQIIFNEKDVGKPKVVALKRHLLNGFSYSNVIAVRERVNRRNIKSIISSSISKILSNRENENNENNESNKGSRSNHNSRSNRNNSDNRNNRNDNENKKNKENDYLNYKENEYNAKSQVRNIVICDCVDNLESREAIAEFSEKSGFPWVYASVKSVLGQSMAFMNLSNWPKFRDIYRNKKESLHLKNQSTLNTAVILTSAVQVNYVFKILTRTMEIPELTVINGWSNSIETMTIR